ncbi:MAG: LON peptidase substrate-binding domain-containing protein [Acidobacteria bacterium]|nr:LON peptidase substrate-binding domain-containing protein [Acidobacteriota bacterium]
MALPEPGEEFLLPLFPLPNVVFFPRTRLPLHVFEPRYRQMVADAMASDERIGMILLEEGWEADYYGAPAVHPVGTLGQIESLSALEDGRFNLILNGQARFRVVEQVSDSPYRVARVMRLPDVAAPPEAAYAIREWLVDLSLRYLEFVPKPNQVPELETAGCEELTNALVMSLPLDVGDKQRLLELDAIIARAERVGELLKQRLETLEFLAPFRQQGDPKNN